MNTNPIKLPSTSPLQQTQDAGKQKPVLKYNITTTKTNWGKETRLIFEGDENHQQVMIKTRDILQRFLGWLGEKIGISSSQDYFTNTYLITNSNSKASTPAELIKIVNKQAKNVIPPKLLTNFQRSINHAITQTANKVERAAQEAAWQKNADAAKLAKENLLEKGRKTGIDNFDSEGRTALYNAVNAFDVDKVKALIEGGANPELASNTPDKKTPKELVRDIYLASVDWTPKDELEKLSKISKLLE